MHADESGQVIEPRREQTLYTLGSEDLPSWVAWLRRTYLPAPDELPPPVTARS